jgi:hypothetical protein
VNLRTLLRIDPTSKGLQCIKKEMKQEEEEEKKNKKEKKKKRK